MKDWLARLNRDLKHGFKKNKLMTVWMLIWMIPIYFCVFAAAIFISISSLSVNDGVLWFKDTIL